jgi:hypothetical protein
MTVPAGILRRLEQLEATVARQQQLIESLRGREAIAASPRWLYVAKTIKVGGTYPTTGNTFGLQFLDREYTPTQGDRAVTDHTRSATKQAIGRTFDGRYVSEGKVVIAFPAPPPPNTTGKGRWWILDISVEIHRGVTLQRIEKLQSGEVKRFVDGSNQFAKSGDDDIVDTVVDDWATIDTGKLCAYAKIGGSYYMLAGECPLI